MIKQQSLEQIYSLVSLIFALCIALLRQFIHLKKRLTKGLSMQSKKNIIFTLLLCAQVHYNIADPAEEIAQAKKEAAIIKAEALKKACEVAPKVGLEAAEILASAFLEAAPKAGSEAAQILVSAFNSNEATSESSDSFIDSAQTTITVIKGLIVMGGISTCLYIAWPKISRYFSSK